MGDSTREFPFWWVVGALFHSIFSVFILVSVSPLVVCSSIYTPLEWFDPCPSFYHILLCIRGNMYSRVYMQDVLYLVTCIWHCSLNNHVHPPFWLSFWCGKLLGGFWVWAGLPGYCCCLLTTSFMTRDPFFIDFSMKVFKSFISFLFFH